MILHLYENKCPYCNRMALLQECAGGWMVYCHYSNPWHAMEDKKLWCDEGDHPELFDTPNEAIEDWNNMEKT